MPEGVKGFQKNNKLGRGQPKKLKTQVKDFIKEHPYAVETLMKTLYDMGIKGDREAAVYIIDRIKGKPKVTVGIDEEDRELLTAATVLEFRRLMDTKLLEEGSSPDIVDGESKELPVGAGEKESL